MALTQELYQSITGPIEHALGLPNEAYTNEAFLQEEYNSVLGKGWIGIAFDDDVPSPGDIFPVVAAGQPLIVLRDRRQQIRVFHNVCRHQGAKLVDVPCSNKRQIVCQPDDSGKGLPCIPDLPRDRKTRAVYLL